eukprot:3669143-Rhodomonas_salina.1
MCGTEIGYAATRRRRQVRGESRSATLSAYAPTTQCPILTLRMGSPCLRTHSAMSRDEVYRRCPKRYQPSIGVIYSAMPRVVLTTYGATSARRPRSRSYANLYRRLPLRTPERTGLCMPRPCCLSLPADTTLAPEEENTRARNSYCYWYYYQLLLATASYYYN